MSANAEPKPAASLSAGLLARKGGARPAMRRQPVAMPGSASFSHDDLGWNDMGFDAAPADDQPAPVPVSVPIQTRIDAIADRITRLPKAPQPKGKPRAPRAVAPVTPPAAAPLAQPSARKAAFTLRLDGERHLRLRLLSAISNRSAQHLLVEALDGLIAENDQLRSLADQVETPDATDRT